MTGFTALVLRHIACEGPGLLGEMMQEKGIAYTIADIGRGKVPDASGYGLLISMGGPMSANDENAWINAELEMTRAHVLAGKPYLGICLGSQMLAKALGGSVMPSPVKEVGVYNVVLTSACLNDHVFKGMEAELPVFQWHGETFELPEGAELLAASPYDNGVNGGYINQAFKFLNAYGFQFHLEATEEMVAEWVRTYPNDIKNGSTAEGILGMFRIEQQLYLPAANAVFSNFLDFALSIMRERI
ncbi:type 1 glutamine amidotransferase [Candidatus Woesearchaeota archaeon]|nr:type 1 glutamine amidotransferase [Candidatus Woesearchaeota archaeon]